MFTLFNMFVFVMQSSISCVFFLMPWALTRCLRTIKRVTSMSRTQRVEKEGRDWGKWFVAQTKTSCKLRIASWVWQMAEKCFELLPQFVSCVSCASCVCCLRWLHSSLQLPRCRRPLSRRFDSQLTVLVLVFLIIIVVVEQ